MTQPNDSTRLIDRLDRDWQRPPYDSLAEAIVLWGLLRRPSVIGDYDLLPLLVMPEHRVIWQAMQRVHAAMPDATFGQFTLAWWDELERCRPNDWVALHQLVDDAWDDQSRRAQLEVAAALEGGDYEAAYADFVHDWSWWYERLKTVTDAREVISKSQEAASCAWRGDVDGARLALASLPKPRGLDVGMDLLA